MASVRGEIVSEPGTMAAFRVLVRSGDQELANIAAPSREAAETLLRLALKTFEQHRPRRP